MNPQHERLNERLEQFIGPATPGEPPGQQPSLAGGEDAEVDALVELAQRLQTAPQLCVNADFAQILEGRLLRHALTYPWDAVRSNSRRGSLRTRKTFVIAACACGLLALCGLLTLALANRTLPASPARPGEQQARATSTLLPTDQATLDLQMARTSLHDLASLVSSPNQYIQGLSRFDTQMTTARREIDALPAGTHKTQLSGQLNTLRSDARQELQGFLSRLTSTASVATTNELGQLGAQIPEVSSATIVLPPHPKETATITIIGTNIQPGAQLLVNGKHLQATGILSNGRIVFTLTWNSEQHPHSLGILNPDGTAAQTTSVTVLTTKKNGKGNG